MKEFTKIAESLIFLLVIGAVLAAILFFAPTTTEFFEFNKFTAILALTIAGAIIWGLKMVLEKKVVLTRTPVDLPIILLVGVFSVASLASIDQFISFFGKAGRIWPSFLALLVVALLYFVATSNLKNRRQVNIILWIILSSTVLASLVAITSYFGSYLPFEFAKIRSFNPLGVINRLALVQAFVIPLAVGFALFEKEKVAQTIAAIFAIILIFSFILINFLPAYIGLIAGLIFLALGLVRAKPTKAQQGTIAILTGFTILILVLRFVPQVSSGTLEAWIVDTPNQQQPEAGPPLNEIDTPKERTISQRAAWEIAAQSIGKRPILGTGPATYPFVYTQLKPRYINATDDWPLRFERSSSDFTEIIATTGAIGALAFLILSLSILRFVWILAFKSSPREAGKSAHLYLTISASIFAYLILSFITTSSFASTVLFFLLLALVATLAKDQDSELVFDVSVELSALRQRFAWFPLGGAGLGGIVRKEEKEIGTRSQVLPWIFLIFAIALSALAANYQVRAYLADYYFRQSALASRSGDGNRAISFLQQAATTSPGVDNYHRALSATALNAALNLSRRTELDENQRQLLAQLAQVAIDQGKAASGYQILPLRLPGISAANVANWENLSSVYQALIGAIQGADVHATNTLAQAVALDPENPALHNALGQLYQRLGNLDLAQRKFEDATIVKSDFGPAHYNLALILIEKEGDVTRIVNELTLAKRFLPSDDPARGDIDEKIDEYNKRLREIQEKAAQGQQAPAEGQEETESDSETPTPTPSASPSPSPSPFF